MLQNITKDYIFYLLCGTLLLTLIQQEDAKALKSSIVQNFVFTAWIGVLVSYACCNRFPQTGWVKTTEMYSSMILEARRLKLLVSLG